MNSQCMPSKSQSIRISLRRPRNMRLKWLHGPSWGQAKYVRGFYVLMNDAVPPEDEEERETERKKMTWFYPKQEQWLESAGRRKAELNECTLDVLLSIKLVITTLWYISTSISVLCYHGLNTYIFLYLFLYESVRVLNVNG